MLKKLFTIPLSWIYGAAVDFRNWLYDKGIKKSHEIDIPIICVGNITAGGTGKTPHTEYVAALLRNNFNIAILSRGYKRQTKGFILVDKHHTSKHVGDEPKQIKLKFKDIPVAVCEDRVSGVLKLRKLFPEIDLIIMDDGMQHRKIETWLNIVLMDYNRPIYEDTLLPAGMLRDRRSSLSRAQIIITTKCPDDIKPIDMRLVSKSLKPSGYQSLFFTRMKSLDPVPVYPEFVDPNCGGLKCGDSVVVMSGIGNPYAFEEGLKRKYKVVDRIIFPDHHIYKTKDLDVMNSSLSRGDRYILTTEKDATKLSNSSKIPAKIKGKLYYVPIVVEFIDTYRNNSDKDFYNSLMPYVQYNHKHRLVR